MEIETKRCTLDTLTVTIKALHVDKKQMTLAVFRQLPEVDLGSKALLYLKQCTWWGVVHYKVKTYVDRWVVFDIAGKLYRASLYTIKIYGESYYQTEIATRKQNIAVNKGYPLFTAENEEEINFLEQALADLPHRNKIVNEIENLQQLFIAV